MKDSVILGRGNSRYLKSVADFKTLYPTYDDFAAAMVAGTLPVDFNGINSAGFQQLGDALGKATLLKDATARKHGLDETALPDDMWVDLVPVGGILWYAKDGIPDGYLKCDGSVISRVDYKRLFDVIGTVFGAGDGRTTFSLPDLRARFIRASGISGNDNITFGSTASGSYVSYTKTSVSTATAIISGLDNQSSFSDRAADYGRYDATLTYYTGYVRPRNIALTPIIKY